MKPILSSLCGAVIAATLSTFSHAVILDAGNFLSLGANPFTQAGTYTVNTSGATPVLTRPDATTVFGIVVKPAAPRPSMSAAPAGHRYASSGPLKRTRASPSKAPRRSSPATSRP